MTSEAAASQREVLDAAEEALRRVMNGVADQVERMPPDLEPAEALRWAGDRATELLAGFAELPLEQLLGLGRPTAAPARETPGPGAEPTGEPLTVRVRPGDTAEVRVWVHLLGGRIDGVLAFALSPLTGPDGATWTALDPVFRPAECPLPITGPWSTMLRFGVPDEAIAGTHHGLVITRGAATAAVPITVIIT